MTNIKYHISGTGKNMHATAIMTSETGSTFSMCTNCLPTEIVEKYVDNNTEFKTRQAKLMALADRLLQTYFFNFHFKISEA